MPAYYRIVPGTVREISAFKLLATEADLHDAVVVGTKGLVQKLILIC
jgi:hypothetical protein